MKIFRRNKEKKVEIKIAFDVVNPIILVADQNQLIMAFSKAQSYREHYREISFYARALSYPGRAEILETLQFKGPSTVEDVARFHPISLPAISQHLKILRDAGLLEWEEKYPYTYYWIHKKNMRRAKKCLIMFLRKF